MDRTPRRPTSSLRLAVLLVTALSLVTLPAAPAQAALIPFIILIENGLDFQAQTTDANGLSIFARGKTPFYLVANGQKGDQLGTATVFVWEKTVPDPFFAPFGPWAGLIVLDFGGGLIGHLSLIQTPTDVQTTIGLGIHNGSSNWTVGTQFSGSWVFSDGTTVAGGTAKDLLIGGVLAAGVPAPIPGLALDVLLYFPTVPFPSDPTPTSIHSSGFPNLLGSFYGYTEINGQFRPVRAYNVDLNLLEQFWGNYAHLLVIETGPSSYTLTACSNVTAVAPLSVPLRACTVSVPGSAVSGAAAYDVQPLETHLTLDLFGIVP